MTNPESHGPAVRRGRIDYIHRKRGEVGREWFTITHLPNGHRTVRALCIMDEDGIVRDVVHSVDAAWRPVDAFVRLSLYGQLSGSAWFDFSDEGVACEARTAHHGRITQSFATGRRVPVFAPHPVVCDGWQAAALLETGQQRVEIIGAHCSPLPNGGSGPLLALDEKVLESVGPETVDVPAGRFDAWRFRVIPQKSEMDPIEIWVRRPDYLLIKAEWDFLDSRYVLAELEELAPGA